MTILSNKWLITKNLDKVEAQCRSRYVEKDFRALLKHDWLDHFESAMIKGYLVAISNFRSMLEGVDINVSDILDE